MVKESRGGREEEQQGTDYGPAARSATIHHNSVVAQAKRDPVMCIVYSSSPVVLDDVTTEFGFSQPPSQADAGWTTWSGAVVPAGARPLTTLGGGESVDLVNEL